MSRRRRNRVNRWGHVVVHEVAGGHRGANRGRLPRFNDPTFWSSPILPNNRDGQVVQVLGLVVGCDRITPDTS